MGSRRSSERGSSNCLTPRRHRNTIRDPAMVERAEIPFATLPGVSLGQPLNSVAFLGNYWWSARCACGNIGCTEVPLAGGETVVG